MVLVVELVDVDTLVVVEEDVAVRVTLDAVDVESTTVRVRVERRIVSWYPS